MTETMTSAAGTVAAGWEPVRAAFEANLAAGREVGAAIAVYHQGRPVVSLAGGSFDAAGSRPYTADTLQLVFSTTKGIAARWISRWRCRALRSKPSWRTRCGRSTTIA